MARMVTFTPDNGDGIAVLDPVTSAWARDGYAVVDVAAGDCDVTVDSGTLGASDTLSVASGPILHNGSPVSTATQSVGLSAADGSNPRKDTVWIDSGGNAQVTAGTAAAAAPSGETQTSTFEPAAPLPSTQPAVVVAEVWVGAGASSLSAGDVRDRRVSANVAANVITAEELNGAVTGDVALTDVAGPGLSVQSGALTVSSTTTTFRYDDSDSSYGTDTSDRDRIDVIPIYATGDQYEITRLRSNVRGSSSTVSDLKHVIANGTANSGDALTSGDILNWRGNEVFDTGDTAELPFTLTQDTEIWIGIENDTGSDQTVSFGFDYRVL